MTTITLTNGTTTITLPPYLLWEDEFAWGAVEENTEYMLSGSLDIQAGVKLAGREITLSGEQHRGWITRETLLDLYALAQIPQDLTLQYHGREFTVRFRHGSGGAIEAKPLIVRIPALTTDKYHSLTIRLIEV